MTQFYNKQIIKLLHGDEDYKPEIKTVEYKDKIGYSIEAINTIKDILTNPTKIKVLAVSSTGSGKTYTVSKVFDELMTSEVETLNNFLKNGLKGKSEQEKEDITNKYKKMMPQTYFCILCPNKIQNEQNQTKYGFKAIVAGNTANRNDLKLSAVYEKAEDIIALKELNPNARLVVVIDESHTLVSAIGYREQAIHQILELEKVADVVLYMTATFKPLQCMKFDKIYNFKDANYKGNTDKITITKADNVKELIDKKILDEANGVFALSSKSYIVEKENILKGLSREVNVLISADTYKTLNNPAYKEVIENETLLNGTSLVSSMFYAGTNVANYNPKTKPIYVAIDSKIINLDDIEQFINRFRGRIEEAEIVIGNSIKMTTDEDGNERPSKFRPIELIVKSELEKVERWKKSYELMVQAIQFRLDKPNNKYVIDQIRTNMEQTLEGRPNHLNCLDIDNDLNITFDYITFFKSCYNKFQSQYFYFPEELEKELKERIKTQTIDIITDNYIAEVKVKTTSTSKVEMIQAQEVLKELIDEDNKILNKYLDGKIDSYKAKKDEKVSELINQEKILKKLKDLINVGVDRKIALDIVTNMQKYVEVDNYIMQKQIIDNNQNIKLKRLNEVAGRFGEIQKIIVKNFKVKDRITEAKLKTINKEIKERLKEDITTKKIEKITKMIFNLDKDNRISSLKIR